MKSTFDRKDFLKLSTAAMGGAVLSTMGSAREAKAKERRQQSTVRLGFVGLGGRGTWHLSAALGIEGVEVPAVCEIKPERLYNDKRIVGGFVHTSPTLYGTESNALRVLL